MTNKLNPDCLFCKIIQGQVPSSKVYEDEQVLAFMNLQQKNAGHTLVIPKDHYRNVFDIAEEAQVAVSRAALPLAKAIKAAFNADGMNLFLNNEAAGNQHIFHYHLHIIPRYQGDSLSAVWSSPPASREELEANAARIKACL